MELLEKKKKKKHRGNELAVSLFYHVSESLTFFCDFFFFFVLLDIMKGHLLTRNAGREQTLSLNLGT